MILLLVIIAMWKRLKLVVALFHEAGKCVIAMPLLLIQPVWTFIVLIAFVAYWLVVLAFIGTSGESVSERVCVLWPTVVTSSSSYCLGLNYMYRYVPNT